MTERAEILIEFLEAGRPFVFNGLRFVVDDITALEVTGWSQYLILKSLNKKLALLELEGIKELFYNLLKNNQILSSYISEKKIVFSLWFEVSKSSIAICKQDDDRIEWFIDLPDNNAL